jgi:hypothetical protein
MTSAATLAGSMLDGNRNTTPLGNATSIDVRLGGDTRPAASRTDKNLAPLPLPDGAFSARIARRRFNSPRQA